MTNALQFWRKIKSVGRTQANLELYGFIACHVFLSFGVDPSATSESAQASSF